MAHLVENIAFWKFVLFKKIILIQEVDLHFSYQNDLRNPKLGSKQSVVVATE